MTFCTCCHIYSGVFDTNDQSVDLLKLQLFVLKPKSDLFHQTYCGGSACFHTTNLSKGRFATWKQTETHSLHEQTHLKRSGWYHSSIQQVCTYVKMIPRHTEVAFQRSGLFMLADLCMLRAFFQLRFKTERKAWLVLFTMSPAPPLTFLLNLFLKSQQQTCL